MALVRCLQHPPTGRGTLYIKSVPPVGYPATAAICGRAGCEAAGMVWLKHDEALAWEDGQTIISIPNMVTKIQVTPLDR